MNEIEELVASRFGPKTKVVFKSSPDYPRIPSAVQFVYEILTLIAERNSWRMIMAAPNGELESINLRLLKSDLAATWADVSHALRGFYELADALIVLAEALCLEVPIFARQLKFNTEIGDDNPAITHLTASLRFRSMGLTITSSTSSARGPKNERKNVAAAEKHLESIGYCLHKREGGGRFTPRDLRMRRTRRGRVLHPSSNKYGIILMNS